MHIHAKKHGPFKCQGWKGGQGGCGEQWAVRGLTIIGHGEDGDLSDGSTPAQHPACPFVDGG